MDVSANSNKNKLAEKVMSRREATRRNEEIDQGIEEERMASEFVIKLLLLGAGESGKSTVLKQMKILHASGFSEEELLAKRGMIYANAIQAMYFVLSGMHRLKIPFSSQACQEHARLIHAVMGKSAEAEEPMRDNVYEALRELWADQGVRLAMERKADFYVPDCAQHFLDSLERFHQNDFVPTIQDILYLRVATMGVVEVTFIIKNRTWRVFDVGGQRSQRKKWIHCFDDVAAVIYVVALSEFDQVLLEDTTTNRMQESLQLFKQVVNNRYFVQAAVILFLNKKDLFLEKLQMGRTIHSVFPEFPGENNYEESSNYIEMKFFMANEVPGKATYCHHTCATDTEQLQFVLEATFDSIVSVKLKGCGLY